MQGSGSTWRSHPCQLTAQSQLSAAPESMRATTSRCGLALPSPTARTRLTRWQPSGLRCGRCACQSISQLLSAPLIVMLSRQVCGCCMPGASWSSWCSRVHSENGSAVGLPQRMASSARHHHRSLCTNRRSGQPYGSLRLPASISASPCCVSSIVMPPGSLRFHTQVLKERHWRRTLRSGTCGQCTLRGAVIRHFAARWSRSGTRQLLAALAAAESTACRLARLPCLDRLCPMYHAWPTILSQCVGFGWSNGVMLSLLERFGWNE